MIGITENPMTARFKAKSHNELGSVTRPRRMQATAHRDIMLIMSLNFYVLSGTIPRTNEPATPKKMKIPPKRALSAPPYPNGPVIAATTAPRLV